jgi:hypothetical protein
MRSCRAERIITHDRSLGLCCLDLIEAARAALWRPALALLTPWALGSISTDQLSGLSPANASSR